MSFVKEYVQKTHIKKRFFSPSKYFSRLVVHRKRVKKKSIKEGRKKGAVKRIIR